MRKKQIWSLVSWKEKQLNQQPVYENKEELNQVITKLKSYPPLVAVSEIKQLKRHIGKAAKGDAFIIQGGDCAERFTDCNARAIFTKIKILMQMAGIVGFGLKKPIIKIGRIAGQYAKPRSQEFEIINGNKLLSFKGDNINQFFPTKQHRKPNPWLLEKGYCCAAITQNYLRALLSEEFVHLTHPQFWNIDLELNSNAKVQFRGVVKQIQETMEFMRSIDSIGIYAKQRNIFISHEGLHLALEAAMTRKVAQDNKYYNLGSHFLWVGDRTRAFNGGHVEYVRGIENPIGIKVGPNFDVEEILHVIRTINPCNEEGKIVLICRFGKKQLLSCLPKLIEALAKKRLHVCWLCDPMHGNTIKTNQGVKTRKFNHILEELELSIQCHQELKVPLGGVHFELTGENITECLGGELQEITENDLSKNYVTFCDPRLNYTQSIETALFLATSRLSNKRD